MNFKNTVGLAVTALVLNMGLMGDVSAKSFIVKCKSTGTRSKVSVDGAGLNSKLFYRAKITSGANAKFSSYEHPVLGEAEFDFDSNPADIKAGATAVPTNFIQNNLVNGYIYLNGFPNNPVMQMTGVVCSK